MTIEGRPVRGSAHPVLAICWGTLLAARAGLLAARRCSAKRT